MPQVLANSFLIINLGCEMLYVIDQRLKAQCITLEKSTQGKSQVFSSLSFNLIYIFLNFWLLFLLLKCSTTRFNMCSIGSSTSRTINAFTFRSITINTTTMPFIIK